MWLNEIRFPLEAVNPVQVRLREVAEMDQFLQRAKREIVLPREKVMVMG